MSIDIKCKCIGDDEWEFYEKDVFIPTSKEGWNHAYDAYDEYWYQGEIVAKHYSFTDRDGIPTSIERHKLLSGRWVIGFNPDLNDDDVRIVILNEPFMTPLTKAEKLMEMLK